MATSDEVGLGIEFIDKQAQAYAGGPGKAIADGHRMDDLTNYCQAIIALNEFIYINEIETGIKKYIELIEEYLLL